MKSRDITFAALPPIRDGLGGARISAEARRVQALIDRATPPEAMAAAPVAPARGVMQLVANVEATRGGLRRVDGAHWQAACALAAMNAQAQARAERRGVDAVLPFGAGQIAVAAEYRALVEWREGSALKCASLEAGRAGGGGAGLFIDSFIDRGAALARLRVRIGDGLALSPRYAMDRGNGRKVLSVRALVDLVALSGADLTAVLRRYGWQADGKHRKLLRGVLCAALDRMQGYADAGPQNLD